LATATILTPTTLADLIKTDFSKIKLKKATVKVPKLKVKNKKITKQKKDGNFPVSSIISILIKAAVEKSKRDKKEKRLVDEDKNYAISKEDKALTLHGGYGTSSEGYGTAPHASYVDYEKLFSYLGKFKAQSAYENLDNHIEFLNKSVESGSFALIDKETMEKGKTYVRYFNSKIPIDKSSLVPIAGMNSAEWEQFKMFMRLDTAMYLLKISTS